ncbi:MAG: S8 family serine peptidase [Roseburia sp.]|nr:S8 family serine peptidase [Roseburia sp.]
MRSIVGILILIFVVSIGNAQNANYYYCNNKKIFLNEIEDRCVAISKASNEIGDSDITNIIKVIDDSDLSIKLIRESKSANVGINLEGVLSETHFEPCFYDKTGLELFPTGYIDIELYNPDDYNLLTEMADQYGLVIVEQNYYMPLWYLLRIGDMACPSVMDIANSLYETGNFSSCSPEFSCDGMEISYDPEVMKQWGLYNSINEGIDINISNAWSYATGRGVKIAIVDSGVQVRHQDLAQNIYMSYDCMKKKSPTSTYGSHGTQCAGIAAAVRNNGIQIAGVAPDAKIMAAGINFNSSKPHASIADGINWAWKNGADIISCSWGCSENEMVKNAIDAALKYSRNGKGCIFVKSAGNINNEITFPGNYKKEIIVVGGIANDGNRYSKSCYGDNLIVCAPAVDILSTSTFNGIDMASGTSMACPHVSGVVALILERNPSLSSLKIREIIAKSVRQVGSESYDTINEYGEWNKFYGYGLIDAYKAVMNTPRH